MAKRVVNPAFIIMISVPIALTLNIFIVMNQQTLILPQHLDLTGTNPYFRPQGDAVSGFKDSMAKYHRSPCPALNVLANHGFLPRDGKNLTPKLLLETLVEVYNLDPSLAKFLVNSLPAQFTLADLGEHNFIEHDASLVHDDSWGGEDPSFVNITLATNLLSCSNKDLQLTRTTLAMYRREREASSAANTPDFEETFTTERALTGYSEAAILLLVMGEHPTSISVDRTRTFLVEERIPSDYEKPRVPVTLARSLWLTLQLKVLALLSTVLA